jgi:alpha-aminoadipate carrier protein LysW
MVECPECEKELDADEDELEVGDELTCRECGEVFEVVDVEPVTLESVEDDDDGEDDEEPIMFDDDFDGGDEDEEDDE